MSNPKDIVPMKAVECPICKGKCRVMNDVVKTKIKCNGCEGKGWVEVHYAQIGEAPKFIPQNIPYPQYPDPYIDPIPYKKFGGGSSDPYWSYKNPNGNGTAGGATTSKTFTIEDYDQMKKELVETETTT